MGDWWSIEWCHFQSPRMALNHISRARPMSTLNWISQKQYKIEIYSVSQKTRPLQLIWHYFTNSQLSLIFGTERPYSILQWLPYDKKFLNWLRTSCVVSITTVATLHTWTADFWANFEQRIISKRVAKRLWAVSVPKDSIRTSVITADTAKIYY